MPTTPYAKALISISGGGATGGFHTPVAGSATVQISPENSSSWLSVRHEIFGYPKGWPTPAGWTLESSGLIVSTDFTPTLITLEAAATRWGKWIGRTVVNAGVKNGRVDPTMTDETWGWEVLSPRGFREIAARETSQVSASRGWVDADQDNVRLVDSLISSIPTSVMTAPSGSGYLSASAAMGTDTLGTVRIRFLCLAQPSTAFKWIAGYTAGGAEGWLLCTEETGLGAPCGQLVLYAGLDGVLKRCARKFLLPEMVGQVVTVHLVLQTGFVHCYVNGHEVADNSANNYGPGRTYTIYNKPTGTSLGLLGPTGFAYACEHGIIEVMTSTAKLNDTQVLSDAKLPIGTPIMQESHGYRVSSLPGATWTDDDGSANLTKTGTVAIVPTPFLDSMKHARTFNIWGDSIAAGRQNGGTSGDGWRRQVQKLCCAAGKPISFVGSVAPNASPTIDYDIWNNGTGGEQLTTRLATFATDLTTYGSPGHGVILAYGINDLVAGSRTSAQLVTDIASACALINAARADAPIVIVNLYDVATASATGPQHTQINTYIAQFATMCANLRAVGYNVFGADVSGVITNPNDTNQLYDGTHPTPGYYTLYAAVVANSVMSGI